MVNGVTLCIKNVNKSDEGLYRCIYQGGAITEELCVYVYGRFVKISHCVIATYKTYYATQPEQCLLHVLLAALVMRSSHSQQERASNSMPQLLTYLVVVVVSSRKCNVLN